MHKLEIQPTLEALPQLFTFCNSLGLGDNRVVLALEEAFVNVATHSGATRAELRCSRSPEGWVFELVDDGMPFDPTAAADHGQMSTDALKAGGQGIRIIKSMADSLLYRRENGLNILTLTKSDKLAK